MVVFPDFDADDSFRLCLLGLVLHPAHREFACVVESLGVVRHLDVAAHLRGCLNEASSPDVVDAATHH